MPTQTLAFRDVNFTPVIRNNQPWLTAVDLAKALGYSRTDKVGRLYTQNKDEFTPSMTMIIEKQEISPQTPESGFQQESKTYGNPIQKLRIFSLRGAHLIAMFARTQVAKEFRKWVLDILDSLVGGTEPIITPINQECPKCVKDASRYTTVEDRRELKKMVGRLVLLSRQRGYRAVDYPVTWDLLNNKLGISRIDELTVGDLDKAKSIVAGLTEEMIFKTPLWIEQKPEYRFEDDLKRVIDSQNSTIRSLSSEIERLYRLCSGQFS